MAFARRVIRCGLCVGLIWGSGFAQSQGPTPPPDLQLPDSPIAQTTNPPAPSTQQSQDTLQKPAGTAAAPAPRITGVAASKPAGAAYAPAKQRRVRVLLIKVGAVVAAGAAVGTVAALSHGSPSRPPGTR